MSFRSLRNTTLTADHPQQNRDRRNARSIVAEISFAYTLLLAAVVISFGVAHFAIAYRATYRQAEADLLGAARLMSERLDDGESPGRLAIPESYRERFGKAKRDHAYFVVWDNSGNILGAGGKRPSRSIEVVPAESPPVAGPHPFLTSRYGKHLDVMIRTSGDGRLLIGRPLAKEYDQLIRTASALGIVGLACVGLGAVAAWRLAKRVSRPIVRIAATAASIDRRNLGRRLAVVESDPREVWQLSETFNAMLDGLGRAFEAQARFTADASHELRTPLSILMIQAEHALAKERSAEGYREAIRTTLAAARRMKTLTDTLLDLAKADAGHLDLKCKLVDLGEIAGSATALLKTYADAHQIQIITDLKPTMMLGDARRLGQVVSNLVGNAIRYNKPGGFVSIEVDSSEADRQARLVVRDNGQGIALGDQPRLFDRFQRGDKARTIDDEAGYGLGLSLVAEIVDGHGGAIEVDSAIGCGTTITVCLPAHSDRLQQTCEII